MRPGEVVAGRFHVEARAGEGGMAVVYRARDVLTGQPVALKVLRDEAGVDAERFVREAVLLAGLSHPAIVRYIAHGTLGTRPWLAMEWLVGEDLDTRLGRAPLTVEESVALARRVCEALAVVHPRGVVHRDIKPANIFLPDGDVRRARLLDFGIARREGVRAATGTGVVMGTPGYMAPEQVRGDRGIDGRVDIFAVGCVLFECLTGHPAFDGATPLAILARILMDDAPRASTLRPALPPALDDLVARMVARNREARFADVGAALAALDALGALDAVAGTPTSVRPAALTHAERRIVCVVAAAVAESGPERDEGFTVDGRTVVSPARADTAALEAVAAAHGARLEQLGAVTLAVFAGDGAARDGAQRAARCALGLAEAGAAPVVLVTGRAEVHGAWAVGEAVDRALVLVETVRSRAERPVGVCLDAVAASLLGGGFVVDHGPAGPFLLGLDERAVPGDAAYASVLSGRVVPFVGRGRELATLDALLAQTVAEVSATAARVTGPEGVGKSRLAREFVQRARAQHGDALTVWTVRADPMGAGAAFGLLAAMLREAAGIRGVRDLADARQKLRTCFGPVLSAALGPAEGEEALAWVGELAGVPWDAAALPALEAARGDAQWMGDALLTAWETLVGAVMAGGPLLLVFDNAHWGDAVSMRFVAQALRRHADRPWMALAVGRDALHDALPRLWDAVGAQEVKVGPLPRKAAVQLCRAVLGDAAPDGWVDEAVARAEGSPLFLEELLRARLSGDEVLPASLVATVQARVEAMEPEARRVLRAASVFGQSFARDGVAALLGHRPTGVGEAVGEEGVLDGWLDELRRREVLDAPATAPRTERATGSGPWVFRHDLLRVAAYAMLTAPDRALGHGLAGAWLRAAGQGNPRVWADHFSRAGRWTDAAAALVDAAQTALAGHDLDAVLALVAEVRTLCAKASAEARPVPDRTLGLAALLEAEVWLWRGKPLRGKESAAEAMRLLSQGSADWFRAAGEYGTALGRVGARDELGVWIADTAAVRPAPDARVPWAVAFARVAVHLYYANDFATPDRVLAAVERGLADAPLDARVEARLAGARAARASAAAAYDLVESESLRALAAYERAGDLRNATTQRTVLGIAALKGGRYDDAAAWLEASLAVSAKHRLALGQGMALRHLALVDAARGDLDRALARSAEAIEHLGGTEHATLQAGARCERAQMLLDRGDLEGAEAEARAACGGRGVTPMVEEFALAVRARVSLRRGDAMRALDFVRAARAASPGERPVLDGRVLTAVVQVEALEAVGDVEGARMVAAEAWAELTTRAGGYAEPARRMRFLEGVQVHAALGAQARRLGVAVGG
jgi:tetratricopeptide (TPR) repeat protein